MAERNATKAERLEEFRKRLTAAPACSDFDEAYHLICSTMNEVEDALTDIPNTPANWMVDGRMYPPQMDSVRGVEGRDDVMRFRSRGHNTLVGTNGSIAIQLLSGQVIFTKAGADGKEI
ncbi:hypothetical protein [Singulisphaera acidiphila]|uniref:Uncharacterized protein n=1 Tax=Singulisphaera acidiphila (strain ATCC BAA-1392 / DSM 18658 / VKM B-2454 / MOB10) TaxID=886293 RepID=L0DJE8_SINAD|nr:hypothetical protein [Singulisphaera acidiphila]AGA28943.1 hypothetical protein Sinac_4778 [Singulisphaera acidiphila DSM 18658]